jgi:mevalonate kinase
MSSRTNGRATVNGIQNDLDRTHLNGRKRQSTPLMPAFMVSAPGKVIVFGEHAVVHGKVRRIANPLHQ